MIQFNFPKALTQIICSFLNNRTFKVHIGNTKSDSIQIMAGCPQGSCLSPILYNIFTSDFPYLQNCIASIFADDTAILNSDVYADDIISSLESSLITVEKYFSKWNIRLNGEKTQAIYFTRKRKDCFIPQRKIRSGNNELLWEEKVKYLGVILDTRITFKHHVSYIVDKFKRSIRILYPFINRKSQLSLGNKLIIFKVIFQSILLYAAPVWNGMANCHVKRLQIEQNKLLKMIYNLPRYFSTSRLHDFDNILLVIDRANCLTNSFEIKCQTSEYSHLNDLLA